MFGNYQFTVCAGSLDTQRFNVQSLTRYKYWDCLWTKLFHIKKGNVILGRNIPQVLLEKYVYKTSPCTVWIILGCISCEKNLVLGPLFSAVLSNICPHLSASCSINSGRRIQNGLRPTPLPLSGQIIFEEENNIQVEALDFVEKFVLIAVNKSFYNKYNKHLKKNIKKS